jgi:serine O-acetyltransferase
MRQYLCIEVLDVFTHPNTVIGNYCHIAANVTLGAKWSSKDADNSLAPVIGDYVEIGAGAVLLGGIRVGNHASIGANAVVLTDVPDYGVAVGVSCQSSRD